MVLEEHFFGLKVFRLLWFRSLCLTGVVPGRLLFHGMMIVNWWNFCCDLYYLQQQL